MVKFSQPVLPAVTKNCSMDVVHGKTLQSKSRCWTIEKNTRKTHLGEQLVIPTRYEVKSTLLFSLFRNLLTPSVYFAILSCCLLNKTAGAKGKL